MLSKLLKPVSSSLRRVQGRRTFSTEVSHEELSKTITRVNHYQSEGDFANRNQFRGPVGAAIFDWGGTTVDAHVIAPTVAFCEVFAKHGVPISMAEARKPMGSRKDLHIEELLEIPEVHQRWIDIKGFKPTKETVDLLFADFVPMQIECLPQYTGLLPGTADTISLLKKDYKLKIGTTTGFTKDMVDILLRDAKKQGYEPDSNVAGDQVPGDLGARPKPFMIYQNLLNLGVWPIESVVKVDDTVTGVGEGLNAGCWSVGVYAYSNYTDVDTIEQWNKMSVNEKRRRQDKSKDILLNCGAHYVIESIIDLPMVIDDINQRLAKGETPMANQTSVPPQPK